MESNHHYKFRKLVYYPLYDLTSGKCYTRCNFEIVFISIRMINIDDITKYKYCDNIQLTCDYCNQSFYRTKSILMQCIFNMRKRRNGTVSVFPTLCSKKCQALIRCTAKTIDTTCAYCQTPISLLARRHKLSKSGRVFCSSSCAASYNNTHKKHGCNRSKLEGWIEQQLTSLYPTLEIHFNRKDAINSELDIYIPSLKLAFELNGIFHYEPIHGQDKLNKTLNNDQRKFQACLERGIELCIIDTSKQKYFKEKWIKPYLDIIVEIMNKNQSQLL